MWVPGTEELRTLKRTSCYIFIPLICLRLGFVAKLLPWKQNSLLFSHNYISQLVNFTQALGLYPQVLGELRYGKYTLKEKCLCQLTHLAHWSSKTLVSQDSTEWEELDAFQGYFNKPMLFLLAFWYRIMPDTLDSHHWAHEDTLTDSNSPF